MLKDNVHLIAKNNVLFCNVPFENQMLIKCEDFDVENVTTWNYTTNNEPISEIKIQTLQNHLVCLLTVKFNLTCIDIDINKSRVSFSFKYALEIIYF